MGRVSSNGSQRLRLLPVPPYRSSTKNFSRAKSGSPWRRRGMNALPRAGPLYWRKKIPNAKKGVSSASSSRRLVQGRKPSRAIRSNTLTPCFSVRVPRQRAPSRASQLMMGRLHGESTAFHNQQSRADRSGYRPPRAYRFQLGPEALKAKITPITAWSDVT